MNKTLPAYITLLGILTLFLGSCESGSKTKSLRSSATKLEFSSPKSGAKFIWGDTINFKFQLKKEGESKAKSIALYIDGNRVHENEGGAMDFKYPSSLGSGGQIKIKGLVTYEDGTNSRRNMGIKIVAAQAPEKLTYQLVNTFDHDHTAYTQGLQYDLKEDLLFEGTGNYTESRLLKTRIGESEALLDVAIPDEFFGEGISLLNDTVYQLTYKKKRGFYYDRTFNKLGEFTYPSEGWGLCNNGENLIMSDGSAKLFFLDPSTFKIVKTIQVFSDKGPIHNLNELEYVDGIIYANIYTSNLIAKIDAESGMLLALINMEGILKKEDVKAKIDVLNGIAYNPTYQTFYVTGKWWPKLFEVRFVEVSE